MLNNKFPFPKSVLILIILFAVASIAAYFVVIKKYPPNPIQPVTPPIPSDDISDWKTYKNEDIGIEFKYPETLGDVEVSYIDSAKKNSDGVYNGKKIYVSLKKDGEYNWISFTSYTPDYKGFKDFLTFGGNDDITSECIKPLSYSEEGEACKIIEVAGQKAIWQNFFIGDECAIAFVSRIYFNNKNPSIYKGLQFVFHLQDAEAKVSKLYNCSDRVKEAQSYAEAVTQSKNIMERKNLSEKDIKGLDIVDGILSSFKFIK